MPGRPAPRRLPIAAGRTPGPTAAIIDSQSVKAAEEVARAGRGYDAGKKINGKRHREGIAVDVLAGQVAATALYEHLAGPVAANPHRLGKPLNVPFEDVLSTRRGDYRALYTVDDPTRVVTVLAVAHRRDAYRPR